VHVLLVEVPGFWTARVAMEQAVAARGWRRALSAPDADALVVCGSAGAELSEVIETTWDQLPGPRVRVDLETIDAVPMALRGIESALRMVRHEPARRTAETADDATPYDATHHEAMGHEAMGHEAVDHAATGHGGMDHAGMGPGGMDHGGMDMAPAGIPLAGGDEDRDGLEMDVLRVPLGPVLPYWPAGLVLRCVLHGDVIAQAEPRVLPAAHPYDDPAAPSPAARAAQCCDSAADVLALAGSWNAAAAARRIAADLVTRGDIAAASAALDRLQRHVKRSYLLRWSLRGLGPMTAEHLADHGLADHLLGDVHDRLLATLARARAELKGAPADPVGSTLDALPHLVTGLDVAAARLVVASFGLQTASVQGVRHG
jgi:hypothetical protein